MVENTSASSAHCSRFAKGCCPRSWITVDSGVIRVRGLGDRYGHRAEPIDGVDPAPSHVHCTSGGLYWLSLHLF